MTSQEWKEVEKALQSLYSLVKLNCDGYEITLCLNRITQFKNAIVIYVNGVIKGKWFFDDCEERRRFLRPIKKYLYSQKERNELKKMLKSYRKGSKSLDPNVMFTSYDYEWRSFKALKSHLIKNNHNIELIKEG